MSQHSSPVNYGNATPSISNQGTYPPLPSQARSRNEDRPRALEEPRAIILSNLPPEHEVDLALLHSLVRGGKLEYSHYDPVRNTFTVHFVYGRDAVKYYSWITSRGGVFLNDNAIYFDLVQSPAPVPLIFLSQTNVSRKLYLGGVPHDLNARVLTAMFERYGVIEYVKIVWERKCGWVSFCRIADAFDALRFIRQDEPLFRRSRIEYGHDDCEGGMQEVMEGGGVSINARKDVDLVVGRFKHLGRRPELASPSLQPPPPPPNYHHVPGQRLSPVPTHYPLPTPAALPVPQPPELGRRPHGNAYVPPAPPQARIR
ncbi:hypothetical protein V1514DRAFT_162694 [Lipomyces japonicus]|uniref:uncharacterized protein n=1 Tax=Lipomyces japonicus TaxID=56871 RepID=UPI0034CF2F23